MDVTRDWNSVPWSTVIARGIAPSVSTRSMASATLRPVRLEPASRIGLRRLH